MHSQSLKLILAAASVKVEGESKTLWRMYKSNICLWERRFIRPSYSLGQRFHLSLLWRPHNETGGTNIQPAEEKNIILLVFISQTVKKKSTDITAHVYFWSLVVPFMALTSASSHRSIQGWDCGKVQIGGINPLPEHCWSNSCFHHLREEKIWRNAAALELNSNSCFKKQRVYLGT